MTDSLKSSCLAGLSSGEIKLATYLGCTLLRRVCCTLPDVFGLSIGSSSLATNSASTAICNRYTIYKTTSTTEKEKYEECYFSVSN